MKQFTYKEIQERLPDYAFSRLLGEEKALFELSLELYPDLAEEVEETRLLFERIERTDFSGKMQKYSKNVSVEVQGELSKISNRPRRLNFLSRLVLPTLGLIFMAYFLIFTDQFSGDESKEMLSFSQVELFSDEDILSLGSDFDFFEYAEFGEVSITNLDLEEEHITSEIEYKQIDLVEYSGGFDIGDLLNGLSEANLSESDFQEILEGMYDETLF